MSTYTVKLNLNHDGKAYEPGETIELEGPTAVILLRDGVVTDGTASTDEAPNEKDEAESKPVEPAKPTKGGKPSKASKKDEADDL